MTPCNPKEVALKSFFLGPRAENAKWVKGLVSRILDHWMDWRRSLFPQDGSAISPEDQELPEFIERQKNFEDSAIELLTRFEKEVPKFSPRYVGHMFSEISLPALIGHVVTLLHNPNNISGESSRVGIQIEDEAVRFLAQMLGYPPESATGHFTSGGTLANFEAMLRARSRLGSASEAQRSVMLVPENKHYSWQKGWRMMGMSKESLWPIALDAQGRLSVNSLKALLKRASGENRPVLMVVSVLGTTELGGIDPVNEVQTALDEWSDAQGVRIWHHVDAAYGGFFTTMDLEKTDVLSFESKQALSAVSRSTSVTLDPHKLGYVPYASGAFLCRDPKDYFLTGFEEAPYIDFNRSIDRGPYTIEGSRSAAGAVATWMSAKTMGFHSNGYGLLLERTIRIRRELSDRVSSEEALQIKIAPGCDTNILCFSCPREGEKISVTNQRTLKVFEAFSPKKNGEFIVSKTALQWRSYDAYLGEWIRSWSGVRDEDELVLVRMSMMNPFFGSVETDVNYADLFVENLKGILK